MNRHFVWIGLLAVSFGFSAEWAGAQPKRNSVKLSLSDGSELIGQLDRSTSLTFRVDGNAEPVDLEGFQMVAISKFRPAAIEKLRTEISKLIEQLDSPKWSERDSATRELSKLEGPVGWILGELRNRQSLEASVRISRIVKQLSSRPDQVLDPRDLVVASDQVKRGWLSSSKLTIETGIGNLTFDPSEVIKITKATYEPREEIALPSGNRHSPTLEEGELPLTVHLFDGSKLLGKVRSERLKASVALELGMSFKREEETAPFFNEDKIEFSLPSQALDLSSLNRNWKIPTAKIKSILVGHRGPSDQLLEQLVRRLIRAKGDATSVAKTRFWVHINDQSANPWNSKSGKAMTWSLQRVDGNICLVGADKQTEPYKGDTSLEEALPILCIKRSDLPPPKGLKASYYGGWTGGEIRITKPVKGKRLTSLKVTNELITKEFGEGWQIAEFHDGKGGWKWWAHWRQPKQK